MKYAVLSSCILILSNPSWDDYLGPQRAIGPGGDSPFLSPITTSNPLQAHVISSFENQAADLKVEISVVDGSKIKVDWNEVVTTSLIDKRIKSVEEAVINIHPSKRYVLGVVKYPKEYFRRICCFDVVLTEGPMAGCVFHFRDGTFSNKRGDLIAVYEVPDSIPITKSVPHRMFYYVQK